MGQRAGQVLLIFIVIGVIAGVASGWFIGAPMGDVYWLGELYLNALKMLILPLIIAAVISAITSLDDVTKFGRLGGAAVAFFLASTLVAVIIGLLAVNIWEPGAGLNMVAGEGEIDPSLTGKEGVGIREILLSFITSNLVVSAYELQLLPLIVFAVLVGIALNKIPNRAPMVNFFASLNDVMMKLVEWVMYFAPVGIFALIAGKLGQVGGGEEFGEVLSGLGRFVGTVLTALAIHFAVLFAFNWALTGRGLPFLSGMLRALLTALGTASSSATVPLTIECAQEQGLNKNAVQFIVPLGSTVNMNGTALFEAISALFIAQAYGLELSFGQQFIVVVTATLAAVGAAGIPEAGLVTLVIVLKAVGLPLEGVGLILTVNWFLDRFRTMVNVWGDSVTASFVDWLVQRGIIKLDSPGTTSPADDAYFS